MGALDVSFTLLLSSLASEGTDASGLIVRCLDGAKTCLQEVTFGRRSNGVSQALSIFPRFRISIAILFLRRLLKYSMTEASCALGGSGKLFVTHIVINIDFDAT